jgi:hypothetical protein
VIDSIDWSVGNAESCGNYGIEHVDALGGVGSFDYGSLVDLGMGPLLLLASYSLTRSTLKTGIEEHRTGGAARLRLADPEPMTAYDLLT